MKIEGDGAVFSHFLVEGITAAAIAYSLVLLQGKPQIWVYWIRRWRCAAS
jgi:hypothetical protein